MNFDVESLQQQIPYYLTAEDRVVLVRELKAIASGGSTNYVLSEYNDLFRETMLQGDGWAGFQLFLFATGNRMSVRGLVLSNSCDVSTENIRDVPSKVVFAPLVKLSAFETMMRDNGINSDRLAEKVAAIRAQKTTNIFFIPAGGLLEEAHIVRFDEAHSMPTAAHVESEEREKIFTLSNAGFYMLVFKLSVHFCRLQESENRNQLSNNVND